MSQPATSAGRLDLLDVYRALAILSVMLFHYTVRWTTPLDPQNHFPGGQVFASTTILSYGWMGVELFFVVSGFVILLTLERTTGLTDFAVRRFSRLFPPMMISALGVAVTLDLLGPRDWSVGPLDFLFTLTFVDPMIWGKMLHISDLHWVDGAYWTLWTEVRFYILAALTFRLARGRFVTGWMFLQVITAILQFSGVSKLTHIANGLLMAPYLPYFSIGIAAYTLKYLHKGKATTAGLALLVASAAIVLLDSLLPLRPFAGNPLALLAANSLVLLLSITIIFSDGQVTSRPGRLIILVGRASYSVYLLHQLVGVTILRIVGSNGMTSLFAVPAVMLAVILAGIGLYNHVELPGQRLALKLLRRIHGKGQSL